MKTIIFVILIVSTNFLVGNEASMINLVSPSGLKNGQAELMIRHRFYGDITEEPWDTFGGMNAGANVSLSGRYQFVENAELHFALSRRKSEKEIGLSYRVELDDFPLYGQFNLQYFSYNEPALKEETRSNFLYLFSLQHDELFNRLVNTLNIAFDGYYERIIFGIGTQVELVDDLYFLAEYIPVLDRDSADGKLEKYIGEEDAISLGLRIDTYGHKFLFLLSNSDDIGIRRTSLGVQKDTFWRFGFNIQRRFDW